MSSQERTRNIVVLGAGVIGLTTAIKIQEKGGYRVTILAEVFPTDPKTIKYTSHWAGAHHVSGLDEDIRQQRIDRETFEAMWELSAPDGQAEGCFLRLPQTEFYLTKRNFSALEAFPNFKLVTDNELIPGAQSGASFDTVTIDVPIYLNYLLSRFLSIGGTIVRGSVQHLSQVVEGGANAFSAEKKAPAPSPPDAIIVCAGIGARTLGGVEDQDMYPVRGQTVILKAPWVRFGRTMTNEHDWTYIIPRRSGDVIVGGTEGPNDWYPLPRPETTLDILTRGLSLCPELAPPEVRATRQPTVDDLLPLIVDEGCGLRPKRKGGVRLEVDLDRFRAPGGKAVPVVYNYGHAGRGYISSFGSANIALELLEGLNW